MPLKTSGWKIALPESIRVGQRVRIMSTSRTAGRVSLFTVGRVTKLLKSGWGVEVRLPDGHLVTRDTMDVAVVARTRAPRRSR